MIYPVIESIYGLLGPLICKFKGHSWVYVTGSDNKEGFCWRCPKMLGDK